ncbi:transcriptional regulator [Desulfocapsa sulfexigens DSM 10523]|uniref:Transcriptional regulator n=1 Tax=Desulfocapsa sulfexigens (strain DSM 10523 / SB164P1) TaxID=1167006 RepID=M1PEU7_DESSD|nr:LysR substrate-binding domain-containing protein [Desulfocapsa sulfexigens]AGF80072.1 transcriptional regulator [Desulfocapsa sulfexigens DSM 10523]
MSITLRQLEIFIAVAETAQVTKASKKLFVTQSAVSMALAELENQLGGSLFDRHGRSLLLNERGRYLLPLSKEILCQVGNVENIMSEKNDTLSGRINVVASTTIGDYILPYLIGAFKRMHPQVHINMLVHHTRYAESLVLDGKVEVGFVEGQVNNPDTVKRLWFEDELVVVAGPTDPLAHKSLFDVNSDFTNTRWIMREEGSGTVAIFREKMKKYLDRINVILEMGHPEAIKKAVESGVGLACLSSLTVCREVEHGWLKTLQFDGVDMRRKLHVISRKNLQMNDSLAEFLNFCDIMSTCSKSRACLSSPWKLQSLLAKQSVQKK